MGLRARIAQAIGGAEFKSGGSTTVSPQGWFISFLNGGEQSKTAGVIVNPHTAMRTAAVWACVRVRSDDVGKVPCHLYRRDPKGGKTYAADHPAFNLVLSTPNPMMGALEFKQVLQASVDLRGNGYAFKEFDAAGRVIALWPLDPSRVLVKRTPGWDYELFYQVTRIDGATVTLPSEAIFHLRGPSLDGMVGLSPIAYHRETIGLLIAGTRYGSSFFANDAQPAGFLKMPGVLGPEATAALRADWNEKHKGPDKKGELGILDGGMEWQATGISNQDAQYMDLRNFQNKEIWRIYRVPPHVVADLDRSTNNNIEQQSLEYVSLCLETEFVRWEEALSRSLLTPDERATLFFDFAPDALLRGDMLSRYQAYALGRNWGYLSANDIRDRENMNPIENGDVYLQPLNAGEARVDATNPNTDPAASDKPSKLLDELLKPAGHANGHGENHA